MLRGLGRQRPLQGIVDVCNFELPVGLLRFLVISEETELLDDEPSPGSVDKSLATDHVGVRPRRARADPACSKADTTFAGGVAWWKP